MLLKDLDRTNKGHINRYWAELILVWSSQRQHHDSKAKILCPYHENGYGNKKLIFQGAVEGRGRGCQIITWTDNKMVAVGSFTVVTHNG